jgi:hypothetical protein
MADGIERRLAKIEALEAIRRQISLYAYGGDRKNDRQIIGALLASDAVWESEGFGRFEGRDVILDALSKVAEERVLWSLHFPVAPIIDLAPDLESASAFWWLWELATLRHEAGEDSSFMGGTYQTELVCEDGVWLFRHITLTFQTITPFKDGWQLTDKQD